ncbi:hypothetical protein ACFO5O_06880 [Geojedonia litorea]|uniref:Nicotinate-nucleotide adenylyltransferase n=1 Tax=Geojedonia litorea TaxID=1268269 RepID=A0ABV9N5C2_9FLAO
MKTQLFGLLFLGLTTLAYSQSESETDPEAENVGLKNVVISANSKYLSEAFDDNTPNSVKDIEYKVATYDLSKSEVFDKEYEGYLVDFAGDSFNVKTSYDSEGFIISSNERFEDVLLPHYLRQSVYKEYPGWIAHSNSYSVQYNHKTGAKKRYKVQLRKDGKRKNLKIDVQSDMSLVYN